MTKSNVVLVIVPAHLFPGTFFGVTHCSLETADTYPLPLSDMAFAFFFAQTSLRPTLLAENLPK